jgi:hypothetical protein
VRRHDGRSTPCGKTFAGQRPDKVVGTTPMGARHLLVKIPNTRALDHDYDEVAGRHLILDFLRTAIPHLKFLLRI